MNFRLRSSAPLRPPKAGSRAPAPTLSAGQLQSVKELVNRTAHLPSPAEFSAQELALLKRTLEALTRGNAVGALTAEERGVGRTLIHLFSAYGR